MSEQKRVIEARLPVQCGLCGRIVPVGEQYRYYERDGRAHIECRLHMDYQDYWQEFQERVFGRKS